MGKYDVIIKIVLNLIQFFILLFAVIYGYYVLEGLVVI